MPNHKVAEALTHIRAAMAELTYDEAVRVNTLTGEETPIPMMECSIGQELERFDRSFCMSGQSTLIGKIGECITNALVELEMARMALEE